MKKAKLMLAAIAVVGIVGGFAAVKAQKFGAVIYKAPGIDQSATLTVSNYTLEETGTVTVTGFYSATKNAEVTAATTAYFEN